LRVSASMFLSVAYAIKTAKSYDVLADMPLGEFLDLIKSLGYHGIEPNIANPFEFDVELFRDEVRSRGLRVSAISTGLSYVTYGYSLSSCNDKARRKAIEFFVKYVELCEELNCSGVVVGLARGRGVSGESKVLLKASIREVVNYTKESKVPLLIEPLNRYETRIVCSCAEALRFVNDLAAEVGRDRIGILFDTFHAVLEERDPYEAYLEVREWVRHIHVADSNRRAPGEGMIDWLKFLSIVRSCGYQGFVSVEALPSPTTRHTLEKAARTILGVLRVFS